MLSETCQRRVQRYQPASERAKELEGMLAKLKTRLS
jgi:hypothetical protein